MDSYSYEKGGTIYKTIEEIKEHGVIEESQSSLGVFCCSNEEEGLGP